MPALRLLFLCTHNSARSILAEGSDERVGQRSPARLQCGQSAIRTRSPARVRGIACTWLHDRGPAQQILGRVRPCQTDGCRDHGLRQRCARDLSGVGWRPGPGALGFARSLAYRGRTRHTVGRVPIHRCRLAYPIATSTAAAARVSRRVRVESRTPTYPRCSFAGGAGHLSCIRQI